jgi:hypothetical protein
MPFKIQVQPDGDYVLTHNEVPMGIFKDLGAAETGIDRIVNPVIHLYDDTGQKLIKGR